MAKKGKKEAPAKDNLEEGETDYKALSKSSFKLTWEAYHSGGHNIRIRYTWPNFETLEFEDHETELTKDWETIKKEGEEPVQEEEQVDAKKGKGAPV